MNNQKIETVNPRRKNHWIFSAIFKCAISAIFIIWIFRKIQIDDILTAFQYANKSLLIIAFSLHFLGYYISALRWKLLLRAQNVDSSIQYLIKSYMVSIFFNNFMPSIIGGDTIRVYDSWRLKKSKAGAIAVISIDRFLGILSLLLFSLGAIFFSKRAASHLPFLNFWIPSCIVGMIIIGSFVFMPFNVTKKIICGIKSPIFQKFDKIFEKLAHAFSLYNKQQSILISGFILSLVLQANVVLHYYLIAQALGFEIPLICFFAIIPLAIFVMLIPISINAIGIRENIFVFFLTPYAITNSDAVVFAWIAYGILIIHGIMGGFVFVLRK